ncbi:MAG TPA: TolC family protein [Candidatus Angelobacter sp.]|nr:TolC family protein [Candidatus Angelobacter sp.]
MSFIRNDRVRKLISAVCLLTFPAVAQQNNASLAVVPPQNSSSATQSSQTSAAASANSGQPGAPAPSAPEPKALPQPTHVDYSKSRPLLPNPFARYMPRDVPPPVFTNSPKLADLVQNGKIMLSLNDAIAIALTDNLDIAIARYNLPIADTDILRTKAGASFLGTNTGVVQNTPGGGVGGVGSGVTGAGAGGTTAGSGGAGTGAGGFVGSTSGAGPPPPNFDPIVNGTLQFEHAIFPLSNTVTTGTASLSQNTTTGNISYSQGFSPGTALTVGFQNSRATSNSLFSSLNPVLNSTFRATITQHLLQGFGRSINTRLIVQAKNNKKITEEGFRNQVITTVSQIENIYWDLVNAYEDFKVKERSLGLAQKTLSDNQKQVEIGTLAQLDVVRAESTVASAEQDLIVSKTNLQLQQLVTKNALTRDLPSGSPILQMDIVPTDTVQIPDQETLPTVESLIKLALDNRPDYNQQRINLKNNDIDIKGVNNSLLPTVDLFAFYGGNGLSGLQNPLSTCPPGVVPSKTTPCVPPGTIAPTGFTDAFGNLFNSSAPDKGLGINISIPLGNRLAESQQVRARLTYRQTQLGLKSLENQISINIRNDVFTVEQNRARVAAAKKAEQLAQQTLDAEQKKYNLGASTYLNVLSDERDLAQSESNLVSAMTNYAKSKVQLDRDTAQTLPNLNIKLDEATTGEIKTQPVVPGTMVNKNALQELTNPNNMLGPSPQPQPATPPAQQPAPQPTPTPQPPKM